MTTLLVVYGAIAAVFVGYTLFAPTLLNLPRFIGGFLLKCPLRQAYADIRVNPLGAALTSAYGDPQLHVRKCTLLQPGEKCGQECLNKFAA